MGIKTWIEAVRGAEAKVELARIKNEFVAVEGELISVRHELRKSKEELEDLKLKKKIEEEDIRHLTKIRLEQNEIEYQKKIINSEREKDAAIHRVKQEYADKLQARLIAETENIKQMYGEILKRLPNINVEMKGKV